MERRWFVTYTEFERGWGQRLEHIIEVDTEEEAKRLVEKNNKENNLPVVPDTYWRAEVSNDLNLLYNRHYTDGRKNPKDEL